MQIDQQSGANEHPMASTFLEVVKTGAVVILPNSCVLASEPQKDPDTLVALIPCMLNGGPMTVQKWRFALSEEGLHQAEITIHRTLNHWADQNHDGQTSPLLDAVSTLVQMVRS